MDSLETSIPSFKRRKTRDARTTTLAKVTGKAKHCNKRRVKSTVARMNVAFRNNAGSGGPNNAMTPASVDAVLQALSAHKRLDKNSVVVDFGCGSGNFLVAAVLRYGAKAYDIEKNACAW